jgi:hypothetical protein
MKTLLASLTLLVCLVVAARADSLPKTSDIAEEIRPDGSVDMSFQMTFDAAPWRQWKAQIGDEPARLRAMMRHQFAALTLENFKLDRDDLNRVAKVSMHSAVGPELRDDGSYQLPVDGYFRLINGSGRDWYFSGNNPAEGYALNSVKITLPPNALNAYVANPNNVDQALIFAVTAPPSPARKFYVWGTAAALLGLLLVVAGLMARRQRFELLPPVPQRALPAAQPSAPFPPAAAEPAPAAPMVNPAAVPPEPIPPGMATEVERPTPPTARGRAYIEPD